MPVLLILLSGFAAARAGAPDGTPQEARSVPRFHAEPASPELTIEVLQIDAECNLCHSCCSGVPDFSIALSVATSQDSQCAGDFPASFALKGRPERPKWQVAQGVGLLAAQ